MNNSSVHVSSNTVSQPVSSLQALIAQTWQQLQRWWELAEQRRKLSLLDEANKKLKTLRKELDDNIEKKYGELTVDEIKHLLFDEKWMVRLSGDIGGQVDQELNALASKALLIAKRYERTLKEIEEKTSASKKAVKAALERMGYKC